MSKLTETIADCMQTKGIITFAEFMEMALYCPEHGFYEGKKDIIGKRGHFYTSVSVGAVLGKLLAHKFENWLRSIKASINARPCLVEMGAHDGQLASDILTWSREFYPGSFESFDYLIIERSPTRKAWQEKQLNQFRGRVRWAAQIPRGIEGVFFSNELLDAQPVHRLAWDAEKAEWFEWGVVWRKDRFDWERMEVQDEVRALSKSILPREIEAVLPDNFVWELSVQSLALWQEMARSLRRGYLLTLDYGMRETDFLERARPEGTVRAYQQHAMSSNVLMNPGEQDITYSVNFDAVRRAGEQEGLATHLLATQSKFLTQIFKEAIEANKWSPEAKDIREFQTLSHPDHLGNRFQALVQTRLPASAETSVSRHSSS